MSNSESVLGRLQDRLFKPSRIFGDRFPLPLDGKMLLRSIGEEFAAEFNAGAIDYLKKNGGNPDGWNPMRVAGSFPTHQQHCPRLVLRRTGGTQKLAGLGGVIDLKRVALADEEIEFRLFTGNTVTDNVEITLCCLNELQRDEVYIWWSQYLLEATRWLFPLLRSISGVFDIRLSNGQDDDVEYHGSQGQPGFQFYVTVITAQVSYDLVVIENVDIIKEIINWQEIVSPGE